MNWVVRRIQRIMLVSGLLTCTMIYAAIAPEAALRSTFGETLQGPLAEIVVRNWGALIALVGGGLVYGAYHPPNRGLILTIAAAGKVFFIALVLVYGQQFLGRAGLVVAFDGAMVALFAGYLVATGRSR